jgi:hypothetical protein
MRFLKYLALIVPVVVLGWVALVKETHQPKIYDCFPFFNELELLQVRFSEMYHHVDKFVILESAETYSGKSKPLHFAENRHLFDKYKDKIIHVVVNGHFKGKDAWDREWYQREQMIRGLKGCHSNDIIFLSDLDEILRGDKVKEIAEIVKSKEAQAVVCHHKMYCAYLNRYLGDSWPGTVATTFKEYKRLGGRKTRKIRNQAPGTLRRIKVSKVATVKDAGWHFNSMGGFDRFVTKLESFSHQELNQPGLDKGAIFSAVGARPVVEIDDSFPLYIRENLDHFKEIGFVSE